MKWKVTAANPERTNETTWEIDADSAREAYEKGMNIVFTTTMAMFTEVVEVQPLEEDKGLICGLLTVVLRMTRALYDLESLEYDPKTGMVTARFLHGTKYVNCNGDSGVAMIQDIVRCIQ